MGHTWPHGFHPPRTRVPSLPSNPCAIRGSSRRRRALRSASLSEPSCCVRAFFFLSGATSAMRAFSFSWFLTKGPKNGGFKHQQIGISWNFMEFHGNRMLPNHQIASKKHMFHLISHNQRNISPSPVPMGAPPWVPHLDKVLQMLQHVIWLHHQSLVIFLLPVVEDLHQEIHVLLTLHSLVKICATWTYHEPIKMRDTHTHIYT